MLRKSILFFVFYLCCVSSLPVPFETHKFKVGIEYEHSLPMSGGSDRYRHKNNYEPLSVTVNVSAKRGYVMSYLDVSATVDAGGVVDFHMIRGDAGSTVMVFELVSNKTDFLNYSYLAYGITEEEYQKISNIVSPPLGKGWKDRASFFCIILSLLTWIRNFNYYN